ncbi:MAG: amphi-Trp domain-containing protein [Planctomycetes bacterium]|nr:amphi-Trp domain-containing protein [Planctomycetota bacterium]
MPVRKDYEVKRAYSPRATAQKLRRLADAIEKRKPFRIQVAGECVHVPADAAMIVEHERKPDSEELEFELKWKRVNG